jgi:hypothetical protein
MCTLAGFFESFHPSSSGVVKCKVLVKVGWP